MKTIRIHWLDSVKGLAVILVVYCHNNPIFNEYIYSFHVPLFFLVSGMFHKIQSDAKSIFYAIRKRFKFLIIPYFLWAILLYLFWFFLGRHYGDSVDLNYSVQDNLIGVFVAQGGHEFMDWGVQLWFIPCLFMVYCLFSVIGLIKKRILRCICVFLFLILGYFLKDIFPWYIWSFDVSLIALVFYSIGFETKGFLLLNKDKYHILLIFIFMVLHLSLYRFNGRIDMYQSDYGNSILLFLINGVLGSLAYIYLFKTFSKITFLSFLGENTIPILAMHLRSMTVIKGVLLFIFGITSFSFNEWHKVLLTLLQILIVLPVIFLIKNYFPILNGKTKKI